MGYQVNLQLSGSINEVIRGGVALIIVGILAFASLFAINKVLQVAGLPHWSIK
jgi:ABC-type Co2+ transport system permease subunit